MSLTRQHFRRRRTRTLEVAVCIVAYLLAPIPSATAQAAGMSQPTPIVDGNAITEDRRGAAADLDVVLTDTSGRPVRAADLAGRGRPAILNLGYFTCPGVCGDVRNGLLIALQGVELLPGEDFDLLTVSIDPNEQAALAREKKDSYVTTVGRDADAFSAHWHFLTGDDEPLRRLASSVGWRYAWNDATKQYDHPPTLVVLTGDGKVSQYLDALTMQPTTFRRALVEAGDGAIGSFLERVVVSCLTYDPQTGVYSLAAMTVMRIGAAMTVLALSLLIFFLWRRERTRRVSQITATT